MTTKARVRGRGVAARSSYRRLHATAGLAILLLAPTSCSRGGAAGRAERAEGPIVIFLVDTLRADRVGAYGAPRATTPALDEVAHASVVYENTYSHTSWTRPAVATLLTSLSASASGAVGRYGLLRPDVPYLPELLSRAGWETAAFLSNANVYDERLGFQRGFDVYRPVPGEKPVASQVIGPAIEWVKSRRSARFFLFVHLIDPHAPYWLEPGFGDLFAPRPGEPPDSHRDSLLREYDRTIRQADWAFGELAAALAARGFWQDATVVFTSDHGEEFGEHGGYGHGWTLFEEAVRVPLVVKYPRGTVAPGRERPIATLADVPVTLASVAGLDPGALTRQQGSLGGDLRQLKPSRPVFFALDLAEFRLTALRRGAYKVVEVLYPIPGRAVYDLAGDPAERGGLAAGCGPPPPAPPGLLEELERLRGEEFDAYPRLELTKRPGTAVRLDVHVDFSDVPKPLLTFVDVCSLGPGIRAGRFELARDVAGPEPLALKFSARDDGTFPALRWSARLLAEGRPSGEAADEGVRLQRTVMPRMTGPTTDEALANLRALGYLGSDAPVRKSAAAPPTASAPP